MKFEMNKPHNIHRPNWEWLGRSLANYKTMHEATAKSKGVQQNFASAKTLTQARKILFGVKAKQERLKK